MARGFVADIRIYMLFAAMVTAACLVILAYLVIKAPAATGPGRTVSYRLEPAALQANVRVSPTVRRSAAIAAYRRTLVELAANLARGQEDLAWGLSKATDLWVKTVTADLLAAQTRFETDLHALVSAQAAARIAYQRGLGSALQSLMLQLQHVHKDLARTTR
jgi:hypothetical protein